VASKKRVQIPELDPRVKDFRNFLYLCWKHLNLPDPTPVQYEIADYIQHGPKRAMVEAFRGVGKSWITSAFVCHQLLLDPTKNILVVSASAQRSTDFTTFTQRLIREMPILQHLKTREGQRDSKISFDVGPAPAAHAPSVKSVGLLGQMTGSRADLIICDDGESLNNSQTQQMRDKLAEVIKEFEAIIKPGGRIMFLGTPQSELSIYALLPQRGYKPRIWPARYPTAKQVQNFGDALAPRLIADLEEDPSMAGQPTDPDRFSHTDLLEREASYGKTGFQLQFMLDQSLSDASRYPLRLSDLCVMNLPGDLLPEKVVWANTPELAYNDLHCVGMGADKYYRPMAIQGSWVEPQGSVLAIDPAGRGADETSYAVVKMLNSQLFLTAAGGFPGGYSDETLQGLADIAKEHKANYVIIESNFGDGMFTKLLQPYLTRTHPVTVEEVRHSIQKERRILDCMEPVMNQHRLIVDRKVIEQDKTSNTSLSPEAQVRYQLFYQMTRLTRDKGSLAHDDRIDVLSMAVAYWVEQMARDVDEALAARSEELFKQEMERFVENCHLIHGKPNRQTTWFSL
jgi:hypothetical protein